MSVCSADKDKAKESIRCPRTLTASRRRLTISFETRVLQPAKEGTCVYKLKTLNFRCIDHDEVLEKLEAGIA